MTVSTPHSSWRLLALAVTLSGALASCDDSLLCTAKSVQSLHGTVRDAQGNAVPLDKVTVGERECAHLAGSYNCSDLSAGKAKLRIEVAGQVLTEQAELAWAEGEEGCHTEVVQRDLALPGPGCPLPQEITVRGTVVGERPAFPPLEVSIEAWNEEGGWVLVPGTPIPCVVEGRSFACAVRTAYTLDQRISVFAEHTLVGSAQVRVQANDCVAQPPDDVTVTLD